MKQEEEAEKKGAQPVNEDELAAVTGGTPCFPEVRTPCSYCGKSFYASELGKHVQYS